jgi:hypothetical protein
MMRQLPGVTSSRKLRLFGCACVRRYWHLLTDDRSRRAVEMVERFVDDFSAFSQLDATRPGARQAVFNNGYGFPTNSPEARAARAAFAACSPSIRDAARAGWEMTKTFRGTMPTTFTLQAYCPLLRDLFGNLFRPVVLDPAWRVSAAVALAQAMYEDRRFDGMPILADALEEAGCTEEAILKHCRAGGEHVRGCWVVDLILDKN